jgi:hypothetical protein
VAASACGGVAVANQVSARWRAAAEPARLRRPAPGRPPGDGAALLAVPDRVGPHDWRDELAVLPAFCDLTGPLPVYRETVARLSWDPASGRPASSDDGRTHHQEQS